MPIKFVYFDVADTLLYKENLEQNIKDFFDTQGFSIAENEIRKTHKICRELIHFPDKTSKDFYQEFNTHFLNALGVSTTSELSDGLYQACRGLSWKAFSDTCTLKDLPFEKGIISNWDNSLREVVSRLLPFEFNQILGSAELGVAKPNVNFFLQALERCEAKPTEVAYVGDSIRLDITPANNLGIKTFLIDRFNLYPHYPGEKISSLEMLAEIL